jgi:pimeloyl-ACP methyl ester carboxylesterase
MSIPSQSEVTYILIHGSWHGAWVWERLRPLLGARSYAVDLPGIASHGPRGLAAITLADWVDAVVRAGNDAAGELVLVAHSMGGIVLPAAAARLAGRVRRVVYVAGLAPAEGRCGVDIFVPLNLPFSIGPLGTRPPGGTLPARSILRNWLCHDLDAGTCQWLLERVQPTPAGPSLTRVSWRGFQWPCPVTYIATRRDRAVSPAVQQRARANLPPDTSVIGIDCGHEAMLAAPAELARVMGDG